MRPVSIANRHPRLHVDARSVTRAIHALDAHHNTLATRDSVLANEAELSLVFLTDVALAQLHDEFLDDPTITDVITFEGNSALGTAGEICVSPDAAVRHLTHGAKSGTVPPPSQAIVHPPKQVDAARFSRELTLYLVHGWLHLAGYDDLRPDKKRVMRRAETRAMAVLETSAALPAFRLRR